MCPLEKGARGIGTRPQMPGRSWQQGRPRGDGKPAGPDRPLGKGVGGIKKERAERQGLGQSPNKNKTEGSKSSLGQPCCSIAAFYRGSMWRNLQVVINQAFKQNQSCGFGNSENT